MDFPSWGFQQAVPDVIGAGFQVNAVGTTANTKGSYVELVASASHDAVGFFVVFGYVEVGGGAPTNDALIDIAFGAASSEVIVVENAFNSNNNNNYRRGEVEVYIPIPVAAGTRISARTQVSSGSTYTDSWVGVRLVRGSYLSSFAKCTTIGANTADSGGTAVDPGASANTWGSWVEFSSSLPFSIGHIIAALGVRNNNNITLGYWRLEIGVGAAGSEIVVYDCYCGLSDTEAVTPPYHHVPVHIAAGQRVAVRAMCQFTDATDRVVDVILYCFG